MASALTQAEAFRGEVVARHGRQGSPIARFASQTPNREVEGSVEAMALYAGQGVGAVSTVIPAARVVTDLTDGAERLLRRWAGGR